MTPRTDRVVGSIALIASVTIVLISAFMLVQSREMARGLPEIAAALDQSLDGSDWFEHWLVACSEALVTGMLGGVAAAGLLRGRRWGHLVLAAAVTLPFVTALTARLSGYAKYAFESTTNAELAVSAAFAAVGWAFYALRANR